MVALYHHILLTWRMVTPKCYQQCLIIPSRAKPRFTAMGLCQLDISTEVGLRVILQSAVRRLPSMPRWIKGRSPGRGGGTCWTSPPTPPWRLPWSPARTEGPQRILKSVNIMEWRGSSMMTERAGYRASPTTTITITTTSTWSENLFFSPSQHFVFFQEVFVNNKIILYVENQTNLRF